jgi:hypothetical protein
VQAGFSETRVLNVVECWLTMSWQGHGPLVVTAFGMQKKTGGWSNSIWKKYAGYGETRLHFRQAEPLRRRPPSIPP